MQKQRKFTGKEKAILAVLIIAMIAVVTVGAILIVNNVNEANYKATDTQNTTVEITLPETTEDNTSADGAEKGEKKSKTKSKSKTASASSSAAASKSTASQSMLNPHHPNSNVIGMVTWIKQNASWANGVAGLFATGKADSSYSASLVEQAITWPKFEDEQEGLKLGILDWLVRRWAAWATRKGIIAPTLKLPPNWIRTVEYSFPVKREPDAQKEQSAINQALRNCTTSLREKFGPDWRERLLLLKEELDFCRENGIPHPALITVSGQTINENLTTDDKLAGVATKETDE